MKELIKDVLILTLFGSWHQFWRGEKPPKQNRTKKTPNLLWWRNMRRKLASNELPSLSILLGFEFILCPRNTIYSTLFSTYSPYLHQASSVFCCNMLGICAKPRLWHPLVQVLLFGKCLNLRRFCQNKSTLCAVTVSQTLLLYPEFSGCCISKLLCLK